MFFIVSYDIPDDKRRSKIAKTLLDFGERVQHSVFECILEDKQFDEMIEKLSKLVYSMEDSIRIYQLCSDCKKLVRIFGVGEVTKDEDIYIV